MPVSKLDLETLEWISPWVSLRCLIEHRTVSSNFCQAIYSVLQNLKTIHLQEYHPDIIYAIAELCPSLTHFYGPKVGITDRHFRFLLHFCPHLLHIHIPYSSKLTFSGLMGFESYSSRIRFLDLSYCTRVTDAALELIANYESLRDLQCLLLRGCINLTDVGIICISQNCNDIRYADFRGISSLTDHSVTHLCRGCPQLRKCLLTDCTKISSGGIHDIGTICEFLKYLDISGLVNVSDDALTKLVTSTPDLSTLYVGKCSGLTTTSLIDAARSCKNLKNVDFGEIPELDDTVIFELSINCPFLSSLDLYGCTNITDESLIELTKSKITNLKHFSIGPCGAVTSKPLIEFIEKFIQLQSLIVSGCSKISDSVVLTALKKLEDLRHFRFGRCSRITTQVIEPLCNHKSLSYVCVSSCPNISPEDESKLKDAGLTLLDSHGSWQEVVHGVLNDDDINTDDENEEDDANDD
ncbi:hypothetical protein GEMRC1_002533 [Eukaryota sp. GEM-RC1]